MAHGFVVPVSDEFFNMIARFNFKQTILALLLVPTGVVCYGLAWLFFRYLPIHVIGQLGFRFPPITGAMIAGVALVVLTISGFRLWLAGGGAYGYHSSAFYHEFDTETASGYMANRELHRVTGTAWFFSQIFLGGPLSLLRAFTLLRSRIPDSPELENRVAGVLQTLRSANRWQSISEYPGQREEIFFLARMGKIDFSAAKGEPRIRAYPESDN